MTSNWLPKKTVTIASGASLSNAVETDGSLIVGIVLPSAWTTANLTLQASVDDSTYNNVYDNSGTEVTIAAAASRYIQINPTQLPIQADSIKLRSGTSGSPVAQGGDRTITVLLAPL